MGHETHLSKKSYMFSAMMMAKNKYDTVKNNQNRIQLFENFEVKFFDLGDVADEVLFLFLKLIKILLCLKMQHFYLDIERSFQ